MLPWLRVTSTFLLSLALSASAGVITHSTSPVTLALTKRFNLTRASKILEVDQARARALKARWKTTADQSQLAVPYSVPLANQVVFYSMPVGIGNPPKNYDLLVDTGSSNTWAGAQFTNAFLPTTSKPTGDLVEVTYGSGQFSGLEYTDTVHVGNIAIANQAFGGALAAKGFGGIHGIIGMGPSDLTCGSMFLNRAKCVPTVTDNAFTQGLIGAREVGISFVPWTASAGDASGELTFGGINPSKMDGPLTYTPITDTKPAGYYVGINQTVSYGDANNVILSDAAGITDTGTTLLLLASGAFKKYQNLTGAVMDAQTGLLRLTPEQFGNLRSLLFTIGGTKFEFIPNAQAWPRQLNDALGGSSDYVYLIVGDMGSLGGGGLDFINGMSFLERFYHVYDIANNRVGFAPTKYTYALIN